MKKEKVFKIILTIVYFIIAIGLLIGFINAVKYPDGMGINTVSSLPLLPISIALFAYVIISIINIAKNKIKIHIIEKVIFILLIVLFIFALIAAYNIKYIR